MIDADTNVWPTLCLHNIVKFRVGLEREQRVFTRTGIIYIIFLYPIRKRSFDFFAFCSRYTFMGTIYMTHETAWVSGRWPFKPERWVQLPYALQVCTNCVIDNIINSGR